MLVAVGCCLWLPVASSADGSTTRSRARPDKTRQVEARVGKTGKARRHNMTTRDKTRVTLCHRRHNHCHHRTPVFASDFADVFLGAGGAVWIPFRLAMENMLDICWISVEYLLDMFWILFGYLLTTSLTSFGDPLDTCCIPLQ